MTTGTAERYRVFVRNWWRRAGRGESGWPGGLVPDPGARKTTIARRCTEADAHAICAAHRQRHEPGLLSRKAEYEREERK
jgi:hypothetical protein